jgi:hypothetical protein
MLMDTSRNAAPRSGAWMHGKERRRPHQSDASGPAPRDLGFSPEGGNPSAASVYGRYKGILGQSLFDVVDSHPIGSRMEGCRGEAR